MAKKQQKFELDEFGFSNELDTPDFSFDAPQIKNDRSPMMSFGKGVFQGAKDTVTSPATIRRMVKDALPKGYGQAMDMADSTASSFKSLYNDVTRDVKPILNDIKRSTKRVLPHAESMLPKRLAEKIKKWSETDDDRRNAAALSVQEQRESSLTLQLGEIFKLQAEDQKQRDSSNDTKSAIQESLNQERHRDQLGQLDAIRVSLQQLANYKHKVESNYHRKSLELQFRHYFVAQDALEEQKRQTTIVQSNLEGILKNTGLPDFAKLKNTERFQDIMRNKFMDSIGDGVFGKRREFLRNVSGKLASGARDKLRDFFGQIRDGMGMAESMADIQEMQQGMGMGGGKAEMGGNIAGSLLGDAVGTKIGKGLGKLRRKVDKDGKIEAAGNKLGYWSENAPQLMTDWARSNKHENGGALDWLVRGVKDAIMGANATDTGLTVDRGEDMQNAAMFTRGTNKSITEIIPGYLARIYRELQVLRTGDEKIELTSYDFSSNSFVEKSKIAKSIFKKVVGDNEKEFTKKQLDEIIDELEKNRDEKLTPEERKVLGKKLLNDNLNNSAGSASRLSDYETYMGRGTSKHADKFSQLFKDYFNDDHSGAKQQQFARQYNELGRFIGDSRKYIQDQVNLGNKDILDNYGFTNKDNNIDMNRLYGYFYDDEKDPTIDAPAAPTLNVHRVNRKRGQTGQHEPSALRRERPRIVSAEEHPATTPASTTSITGLDKDTLKKEMVAPITDAIHASNTKSFAQASQESLSRIEGILNDLRNLGIAASGNGGGGGGATGLGAGEKPWQHLTLGDLGKGAVGLGKKGFNLARGMGKEIGAKLSKLGDIGKGVGKQALDLGIKAGNWAKDKVKQVDVYIRGEATPRLIAWKLKAGHYIDKTTGEVIKSYDDIKGDIVDKFDPDNILVRYDEIKDLVKKSKIGGKMISLFNKAKENAQMLGQKAWKASLGVYGVGLDLAKKAYDFLLDGPQDVYVKGKPDPVLLARVMKVGGYASRLTSKEIRKVSDIDGPVVDDTGNVILSHDDIAAGLLDKHGKPLRTGIKKLMGMVGDAVQRAKAGAARMKEKALAGFGKVKDFLSGKFTGGINLGNNSILSGNSIGFGGSGNTKVLLQIRDLLNFRLPGEPTLFTDDPISTGPKLLSKIKHKGAEALEKVKSLFTKHKDDASHFVSEKASTLREKFGSVREKFGEKFGKATERVKSMFGSFAKKDGIAVSGVNAMSKLLAEIRDRLPKPKKHILGDIDGDGVREGSYEDLMRKKGFLGGLKEKAKEKLKPEAAPGDAKPKAKFKSLQEFAVGGVKSLWNKVRGKEGYNDVSDDPNVTLVEIRDLLNDRLPPDGLGGSLDPTDLAGGKFGKVKGLFKRGLGTFGKSGLWKFAKGAALAGAVGYGTDALMGKMGVGGNNINQAQDDANWEKASFLEKMNSGAARGVEKLGRLFFLDNMANEAQAKRVQKETQYLQDKTAAAKKNAPSSATPAAMPGLVNPPEKLDPTLAAQLTKQTADNNSTGLNTSGTMLSVAGSALPPGLFQNERIGALDAIRYKTYGLNDLAVDKVRALSSLEAEVSKNISYSKGDIATWSGAIETILGSMGPQFGVEGINNKDADNWVQWFRLRFLPVYLNYLSGIAAATGKQNATDAVRLLKPQQTLDIATVLYTTTTNYNGKVPVWQVSPSPWPDYDLNSDSKSVDINMEALKEQAKKKVLDEAKGTSASPTGLDKKPGAGSLMESLTGGIKKGWEATKNMASGAWDAVKSAGSKVAEVTGLDRLTGGRSVDHPGKGTGGDINDIPQPKGNRSWSALKDTILAAAKMVGVDEKLMASMAAIESGFDYTVKAGTSSATGLYQFVTDTWRTMMKKFAPKYGIDPNTPPTDPRANALMGAEYIKLNADALQSVAAKKGGLTDTDLYLAHFLGAGGAKKFLSASPDAIGAQLLPEAARANANIFFKNGQALTIGEIYNLINSRVQNKGKSFGIDVGSSPTPNATPGSVAPGGTTAAPTTDTKTTSAPATTASAPAAPSSPIPVSDQTPGVAAANASPTPPVAAANVDAKSAPAPTPTPSVAPDVAALGSGFMSPRARDLLAQKQFQKDVSSEALGKVNTTLEKSLDIQQQQLDIMSKIFDLLVKKADNTTKSKETSSSKDTTAPKANAVKPSRQMPTPPVSMAKGEW